MRDNFRTKSLTRRAVRLRSRWGQEVGPVSTLRLRGAGAERYFHHQRHAFDAPELRSGLDLRTVSDPLDPSSASLTFSTDAGVAPSLKLRATDQLAPTSPLALTL